MSKMKHLLRKLHIGGGINDHHHHQRLPPAASSTAVVDRPVSSTSTPVASSSVAAVDSVVYGSSGNGNSNSGGVDFNLLEEEFQVQLALAISVSDPDTKRSDPESVQIDAAKRISLGSVAVTDSVSDSIALRYWSYNVVNYTDKVIDGFYDVYGIASNSAIQGKMPLLVDLQAISILDNVDYEVVLVNRAIDPELQQLENKASMLSLENQVSDCLVMDGLIQKLAELVVDRMGGPVGDADEISTRWMKRSPELRNALNSIVIPLGRLDVGLSRHRALLFKVLADRINLPCMLVKGSYYTGTDDGAVNLIKIDNGSEYIIDLMGAPGTLIPAEVPSCHLLNTAFDVRGFSGLTETVQCSSLLLGQGSSDLAVLSNTSGVCQVGTSRTEEALFLGVKPNETPTNTVEMNQIQTFEQEFAKIFPSPQKSEELLLDAGRSSAAENIKVKNVSKYVISAAKNPGFAQKLHAVLLESGASPPPDLFSDMNQQDMGSFRNLSRDTQSRASLTTDYSLNNGRCDTEQVEGLVKQQREMQVNFLRSEVSWPSAVGTFPLQSEDNLFCAGSKLDSGEASAVKVTEMANHGLLTSCNDYNEQIHPMLGEVGEWEIPWEDLQIGERIGIGSYGEVYHADWNGTEVAVKKFLDQDLSGDALLQFKCEAEIMLRLRHPNVILFMGAVTRPPHLSILTEFLPRGSLYRLLHRPNPPLDEKRRLRMAIDVAKGMNYLHTSHPPIVHRDLKSPNLLVDKNWVVKVCDFGLSRLKHHTFLSSKSTAGTPEWMAPEVLRNEPANEKCDVYSFGVILWELTTCRIPWSGLNPMQVVGAVGFQNRRLEIPGDVDPAVTQIIHDCWQREPHLRPSFSQLISRLRLIQHLTSGGL